MEAGLSRREKQRAVKQRQRRIGAHVNWERGDKKRARAKRKA